LDNPEAFREPRLKWLKGSLATSRRYLCRFESQDGVSPFGATFSRISSGKDGLKGRNDELDLLVS
jgi:hypothetical protein